MVLNSESEVSTGFRFENFGWIQASQEIEHPEAQRNQGKIYLLGEDVQEDLPGVGCAVTFFLYEDANGLGAMNVRPDAASAQSGPKGRWQAKATTVSPGPFRGGYAPLGRQMLALKRRSWDPRPLQTALQPHDQVSGS